ncbi:hypothetical protein CRENBAI_026513 [Crenichthys baileyi]|uniref:Peptidase A2 domain-containing protein n=1 Tax=Crenichthys baileyi TaxID=28760 RepID=A0AAV9R841_9TELE
MPNLGQASHPLCRVLVYSAEGSEEVYYRIKERIPVLQPGQFDGSAHIRNQYRSPKEELCIQIVIYGRRLRALLDSGARRNVLPMHHFNSPPAQLRPSVQPSTTEVLQGIGPKGLAVQGEVVLPVLVGSRRLPIRNPSGSIARTTILKAGREYVVPEYAHISSTDSGVLTLSLTKTFIERHGVLVAHAVVQPQRSLDIPIRVFNPGATPVALNKAVVAGVLQPAEVVDALEPQPLVLYEESCTGMPESDCHKVARLLQYYADFFLLFRLISATPTLCSMRYRPHRDYLLNSLLVEWQPINSRLRTSTYNRVSMQGWPCLATAAVLHLLCYNLRYVGPQNADE